MQFNHEDTFYSDNIQSRYHELITVAVINGKVISLHKEIKYVKKLKVLSMISVQNIHWVQL